MEFFPIWLLSLYGSAINSDGPLMTSYQVNRSLGHLCQWVKQIYQKLLQFNSMIARLLSQTGFKMSIYRSILVNDPTPFDILINNIPANGLHKDVSDGLSIPYLSKYKGSKEELSRKLKYEGVIIGDHSSFFFSIPTARVNSQQYYYIHYLLDTGSPYTTLTHQALCCLYEKKVDDQNVLFPSLLKISIAGKLIQTHLSNLNPTEKNPTHNYQNVNLLGMNFLRQFKRYKHEGDFITKQAFLELIELIKQNLIAYIQSE